MSDPDPIVAFLTARLDDEAQFAREAVDREWFSEDNYVESRAGGEIARFEIKADARLAASWGPRRVLADVEAKRELLRLHGPMAITTASPWHNDGHLNSSPMTVCRSCQPEVMFRRAKSYPCRTVKTLARVHADHPDFDPSWSSS